MTMTYNIELSQLFSPTNENILKKSSKEEKAFFLAFNVCLIPFLEIVFCLTPILVSCHNSASDSLCNADVNQFPDADYINQLQGTCSSVRYKGHAPIPVPDNSKRFLSVYAADVQLTWNVLLLSH